MVSCLLSLQLICHNSLANYSVALLKAVIIVVIINQIAAVYSDMQFNYVLNIPNCVALCQFVILHFQ